MDFKNIDKKYRFVPFWSWNEKLDTEETKRQIEIMDKAGIGGYFMHARGGLETEYMGREWFENVEVGITEGEKRGMEAWAYDENGWPSGFGNGMVNGLGVEYQQKYLRYEKYTKDGENTICIKDGYRFYYDVNPFYVDTLSEKVVACFIDKIYKPYYEKYGSSFKGFFTDEPQISRNGIPWSFILPEEYSKAYGEDLLEVLLELFENVGDYKNTRIKFYKLITDLFSKNFMKQIYDWCEEHNLELTGHLVCENTPGWQLVSNGACMPHYEYFHLPGIDFLGRTPDHLLALQISSVCHQLGKKDILTETYGVSGHSVEFDELKYMTEWQLVRGITRVCPHLEGYSLRGIRKRDYPPAMFYQQPWWEEYRTFIDAISRVGMLLSEGEVVCDTLLMHPQTTAWTLCTGFNIEDIDEELKDFFEDIENLERKQVMFHLGDETIMERHARVEGNELVIGTQRYKKVLLTKHTCFMENTQKLLDEFKANGGVITTAEEVEANTICDNSMLTYTFRKFPDFDMHYFVNETTETISANIAKGSKILNQATGELMPFDGRHTFGKWESIVVIDDGTPRAEAKEERNLKPIDLSGNWKVEDFGQNALTIDKCDVYFDGELVAEKESVIEVIDMACALKRRVNIRIEYSFNTAFVPEDIYLVCEVPHKFDIKVNGRELKSEDEGYFVDKAFRKLSLAGYVECGKNVVTMEIDYTPPKELLENIEKSLVFESEKNKLTYDVEMEPIYIVGDFGVRVSVCDEALANNAIRVKDDFVIEERRKEITLSAIEQQGFPFYAGRLSLSKTINLEDTGYKLQFSKKGVNALKVKVNGNDAGTLMWAPFELDLSPWLNKGENKIEITIVNNLRNLMGPHHSPMGEEQHPGPISFRKLPSVWTGMREMPWNEDYCFVEFSLNNIN